MIDPEHLQNVLYSTGYNYSRYLFFPYSMTLQKDKEEIMQTCAFLSLTLRGDFWRIKLSNTLVLNTSVERVKKGANSDDKIDNTCACTKQIA